MLQTAVEAARRAGQIIVERYSAERDISFKGQRDIVTDTDTAAEAVVLDMIRTRFPDHAILSEEAGGSGISDGYTWVVDPLDGTTNYAHRLPIFSVSIGVLEAGEPLIGVVYEPLLNQMFIAERGGGALLNDVPMCISRTANFGHTVMGFDWTRYDAGRQQVLACLREIVPRCGTIRGLGSAALGLTYVAAGILDAYFHLSISPWDTAAGMLLITEAGGRCTTLEGEPYHVNSPGILVTNGLIHDELLDLIHSALV
ncbi:MAG: inositol monophosphatase [Chloroflexi bacterium]|nr:inositol monophosphatase [Chloroflexota bacterium]